MKSIAAPKTVGPSGTGRGTAPVVVGPAGAHRKRDFALIGAALLPLEVGLVALPIYELVDLGPRGPQLLPIAAAIAALIGTGAWTLAMGLLVAPIDLALRRKRAGEPLSAGEADRALDALLRTPRTAMWMRAAAWSAASLGVALYLQAQRGLPPGAWQTILVVASINSYVAALPRALLYRRLLFRLRPEILPNVDPLRLFGATYRDELVGAAIATGALGVGLSAVFVYAYVGLTAEEALAIQTHLPPVIVALTLVWYLGVRRLPAAIDAYLGQRDDARAARAHQVAQALPYWLAGTKVLAWFTAAAMLGGLSHFVLGISRSRAVVMALVGVVVTIGVAQLEGLWHRATLRPLLSHLAARHRLPLDAIRTPLSLRRKLLASFGGLVVFTCALSLLYGFLGVRGPWSAAAFVLGVFAVAITIIVATVHDLTGPLHSLEERAIEMSKGELARPVVAPGEADEIGRLAFAFEEMRRALREKLRSTESVSVALEREVLRRTEDLERTNRELKEAIGNLGKAQDDLVRSEKMASMGRLVAGIAHEINNPVNAVVNSLRPLREELGERFGGQIPEDVDDMLRVIARGAERTKAIVQALHHYSRGDRDQITELDLHRGIDETLELLRHQLRDQIKVERRYGDVGRVRGLAGQIQQVFVNLIVNAAQALLGKGGGTITITTSRQGGMVVIEVADDGPGIPPDVLPRIFDPFFTTKDVGEGSGLGLSIVHGIVDRHGGTISVDSHVGRGTTFKVSLPAG